MLTAHIGMRSNQCGLPMIASLMQAIGDLVEDGGVIQINDKKLLSTLRVKLKYSDQQDMQT